MALGPDPLKVEPDVPTPADVPDVPLAPEPPVNELEPEVPRPADVPDVPLEPDVPLIEEPPPRLPVVLEDWSVQSRVEEPEEALGELLPWARATQVVPAKRPAAKPNRVSCCLIDFSTLSAPNRRSMAGAAV